MRPRKLVHGTSLKTMESDVDSQAGSTSIGANKAVPVIRPVVNTRPVVEERQESWTNDGSGPKTWAAAVLQPEP
jgi:hypothetical protein